MELIDKAEVKAEIKRYKHKADKRLKIKGRTLAEDLKDLALQNLCGNLIHFLDTLELKEVDLEGEIEKVKKMYNCLELKEETIIDFCAKHFFELGLKSKGE